VTFVFPTGRIPTRDWLGAKVGRLEVTAPAQSIGSGARWHCLCSCGGTVIRTNVALRRAAERGSDACCDDCRAQLRRAAR
jgi:hypothetical protein